MTVLGEIIGVVLIVALSLLFLASIVAIVMDLRHK